MPSLKAIKKRIGSVKNTQKITKAMKIVAAAKLRRAQQRATQARFYLENIQKVSDRLLVSQRDDKSSLTIAKETITRREFLIFTSDKGLCGGFNSNLLRKVEDELTKCREQKIQTECRMVGKKGRDYFKAKRLEIAEAVTNLYENLDRQIAEELAKVAIHRFLSGRIDQVWIAFNFFKSALTQEVRIKQLLPVAIQTEGKPMDYIYEPNGKEVLNKILGEWVASQIYSALLESVASELAARMAAMDNATKNASEMIDYLTLAFNRARQATITKELLDIVGGAEALR